MSTFLIVLVATHKQCSLIDRVSLVRQYSHAAVDSIPCCSDDDVSINMSCAPTPENCPNETKGSGEANQELAEPRYAIHLDPVSQPLVLLSRRWALLPLSPHMMSSFFPYFPPFRIVWHSAMSHDDSRTEDEHGRSSAATGSEGESNSSVLAPRNLPYLYYW